MSDEELDEMIVGLHTRLKPGAESWYEQLHREIPEALLDDLTSAGVQDWSIWRSGIDLFHHLGVEDRIVMRELMQQSAANQEWQQRLVPLLAPSPVSSDLDLVWSLRRQRDS